MIAWDDEAKATNVFGRPSPAVGALQMPLLLANVGPQLVHFDPPTRSPTMPVVQLGTAAPNASAKAHDRVAVDARKPLDGPDAHALRQATDDLDLLIPRKQAHSARPPKRGQAIIYN